jgi:DNA-binding IclR family transcriptional regulator
MSVKPKDYKVPALEKGLMILETLSHAAEPMSLTSLCRTLERGPSEINRMVGFLEERGYIIREAHSGNYHLSLKLYELAHLHSPVDQLLKAAAGPMRELALAVRESCHLSVLHGGQLVVLLQQESPEKLRFSVEIGAKFDCLTTASGRLLLACMPEQERVDILSQHAGYQAMAEDKKRQLHERLGDISRIRLSSAEGETRLGVQDTAVLVGNPRAGLAAALCIPRLMAASVRQPDEAIVAALRACAFQITKAMGVNYDDEADLL